MSKKLLLADDSITIQKVIGITFANEDYDLTIVDNGDVALEKARAVRPDLILADVFMPGKNGYELTAAVKRDPSLKGVPVLLLAGTFEPFDEDKARNSGADGWIAKPFESQTLIDRVEELLAQTPQPTEPVEEAGAPVEMPAAAAEEMEDEWGEAFDLGEEGAIPTDEDLWGSVSFGQEDLAAEPEGAEEAEEEPFVFEEEPLELAEETPSGVFAASADEEDFLFEEELFAPAQDAGVEQESVAKVFAPAPEEEPFVFEEEPLELAEETPSAILAAAAAEEEEFIFEEEPFELAEESPVDAFEAAAEEEEDFVFAEEPLEVMEETPSGEKLPEEPFAPAVKEETFVIGEEVPVAEAPTSLWGEPEEEILLLDEADILEEEELEAAAGPEPEEALALEEDVWGWEEEAETAGAAQAEDIFGEPGPVGETLPPAEEDFSFLEEGPEWGAAEEPEPGEEEPFAPVGEETFAASPIAAPEAVSAPPAPAAVEAQVRGLSEEELAQVVEKVAGAVIERLAGTVLEKIAWEVVPDLAESMIKEELRRLKGEAEKVKG
jgi:CheY-like chemotaxis protein